MSFILAMVMSITTLFVEYWVIIFTVISSFTFIIFLLYYINKKYKNRQFYKYTNIGLYDAYDDKWQCPTCAHSNSNIIFICKSCGYKRII